MLTIPSWGISSGRGYWQKQKGHLPGGTKKSLLQNNIQNKMFSRPTDDISEITFNEGWLTEYESAN